MGIDTRRRRPRPTAGVPLRLFRRSHSSHTAGSFYTAELFFGQGVPSHYRATFDFKRDGYALSVFRQHFKRQETKNGKTVGLLLVRQN